MWHFASEPKRRRLPHEAIARGMMRIYLTCAMPRKPSRLKFVEMLVEYRASFRGATKDSDGAESRGDRMAARLHYNEA